MNVLNGIRELLGKSLLALGPWGPFLAAFADSGLIPLAQGVDALIIAQAMIDPETAHWGAAAAVVGSVLGSFALYWIARRGGRRAFEKSDAAGRIDKVRRQMEEHGALVLVLPAMIPLPLPLRLFVIGSGVFRIRPGHFLAAMAFARSVRYLGLALVTVHYGPNAIQFFAEHAWTALAISAGLGVGFFLLRILLRARRGKAALFHQQQGPVLDGDLLVHGPMGPMEAPAWNSSTNGGSGLGPGRGAMLGGSEQPVIDNAPPSGVSRPIVESSS